MFTLEKVKQEPCLRLDYKARNEINLINFNNFKELFPALFSEVEYVNFDLPIGWITPLIHFCTRAQTDTRIQQVKQKLGALRIYTNDDSLESEVIKNAVSMAHAICEFCGSNRKVEILNDGYICNTCIKCRMLILAYRNKEYIPAQLLEDIYEV